MRALLIPLLLLASPGCDEPGAPEAPVPSVTPQRISYADIEENGLHGPGCAFAPGTSMAPIVMAFTDYAVMKVDDEIRRFRIDQESGGSRIGRDARYLAEGRVLVLTTERDVAPSADGPARSAGNVRLTDDAGAILFATKGTVQCGP